MALTDQPYLPLYVDDWMNNNKLKVCSPQAHGIMISIMCLMHKEEFYGKILLKQKFKQSGKQVENFACQIAKQTSFDVAEINPGLQELILEKVLIIDGDYLISNRMVKDAETSIKRANSGKNGGLKTQDKNKKLASKFAKAKDKANAGIGIVIENEDKNVLNAKIFFENFWNLYDKKAGLKKTIEKKWNSLSLIDQQAAMVYIPKYKIAQPDKQFRKNPETFLNQRGWEDEIIERNGHSHTPTANQPTIKMNILS